MSELDDEFQADVIDDMPEREASAMIAQMDPDDAADIIGALPYDKAEKLLNLMGVKEEKAIRQLLGYPRDTAGGIMTTEFVTVPHAGTVADAKRTVAALDDDFESVFYVYTLDADRCLAGVLSMRSLLCSPDDTPLSELAHTDLLVSVAPDDDQATVAEEMGKYSLVAIPVVDEERHVLGIVTVDDALAVMEDEHERDMQLASGTRGESMGDGTSSKLAWFLRRELWFAAWIALALVVGHLVSAPLSLAVIVFLPIVLLVADDMAAFASSYLIDDDDAPSLGGLVVRNLCTGVVMGALGWLLVSCAVWTGSIPAAISQPLALAVAAAAMVTVALSVALTAPYTKLIEKLLDEGKEPPGIAASLACMLGASVVFVGLSFAFAAAAGVL
jgi:Mg/Co/Ni transporter MgtE